MRNEKCENCKFWIKKVEGTGECHRDSPSPDMSGFIGFEEYGDGTPRLAIWPLTYKDEWCGEHEPRSIQ